MLAALCCPDDRTPLEPAAGPRCPACGRDFTAPDGILRMLPTSVPTPEVLAERRRRDVESESYDRLPALRVLSLLERPLTLAPLSLQAGTRLVEIGCGTGRMSVPAVRSGADCVLIDHSLESLRFLHRKLTASDRRLLVQADAACLPVRDGWADTVLSSQMLEHLPAAEMRRIAIAEMRRVLQPNGRLALSAYRALRWLSRDGKHSGEICFHRFERDELRELLTPGFRIDRFSGGLLYIWLAHAVAT